MDYSKAKVITIKNETEELGIALTVPSTNMQVTLQKGDEIKVLAKTAAELIGYESQLNQLKIDYSVADVETDPVTPEEPVDPTKPVVKDATALKSAMSDPQVTEVTIDSDISLADGECIALTSGSKTVNLNGHTITYPSNSTVDSTVFDVTGGTLTINGDGKVDGGAGAANNAVWARGADAKVIINGGSYTVGTDANGRENSTIYASNGAAIEINGGYYESAVPATTHHEGMYYVINVKNGSGATITCTGGSFLNQNPADGDDEDKENLPTFVADGYTVTEATQDNGTLYTVTKVKASRARKSTAVTSE